MNKSGWVFAGIMALLLLLISFVIGLSVGAASHSDIVSSDDSLSAWISALATVCIAVLTIFLAKETWALRQVQISQIETIRKESIKPYVTLFLKKSTAGFNLPNVHIVNNGKGGAQNIRFKFSSRIPDSKDVYDHITEYFLKLSMIKNGISSLAAGESRTSYIFSFYELHDALSDRSLTYSADIDIDYEDYEGESFHSKIVLDFAEYRGLVEIGDDALQKMSASLDKLQQVIGQLTTGFKRFKTDVYTSSDRQKEAESLTKRLGKVDDGASTD